MTRPAFSLAVYCGSRPGVDPDFATCATAVGHWIGQHGGQLVYGGGNNGLMGLVAQATQAAVVPFLLRGVADGPDAATLFQADRIHPVAAAQPRMLDNVWPELRKLLR